LFYSHAGKQVPINEIVTYEASVLKQVVLDELSGPPEIFLSEYSFQFLRYFCGVGHFIAESEYNDIRR
jgi:hypothetical protein